MKVIEGLKNKHLAAFQRELRAAKPDDVDNVAQLPDSMFYEIANRAALAAGWLNGATAEQLDNLTYKQAEQLALDVWKAYSEARAVDPN